MTNEVHANLMQLADQFIGGEIMSAYTGYKICIAFSDKETIEDVITICRNANMVVRRQVVGRGDVDAEMHLYIREKVNGK